MIKSFIDKCISGEIIEDHYNSAIDDYTEVWHSNTLEADFVPLHEFLGMTIEEYAKWMERKLSIKDIVEIRKSK